MEIYYQDQKYFLFETESIPTASNEIKEYALESFKDDRNINRGAIIVKVN
jgi:hypothetical protein